MTSSFNNSASGRDVEAWENELDCLGSFASFEDLKSHLDKAPKAAPRRTDLQDLVSILQTQQRSFS